MSAVSKFYDMASLSEASYVLFDQINVLDEEKVNKALQDPDLEGRFSATQAEEFVMHWAVVDHQKNTGWGFSATLFKNKDTREYVYACRGTEGISSLDLWSADVGNIVTDGLAIKQIVAMCNDCLRMRAPDGQVYEAIKLDLLELDTIALAAERVSPSGSPVPGPVELGLRNRTDVVIDEPLGIVYTITTESSNTLFSDERATGSGTLATAGLPTTVTGHSLGGHLASAYTRIFSSLNAQAYTINGAGFADAALSGNGLTNLRNLFSMLGGGASFDSTDILNLFGSQGPEFVTMDSYMGLKQPGAHKEIFIENWNLQNVFGHGAVQMTDAMAVYDLFFRIDERFRTGELGAVLAELKPLFEAASNDKYGSFESVVNVIGGQLVQNYVPIQKSEWGNRDTLYSKILAIQTDVKDKNLHVTSLVSLAADQLKAQAMGTDDLGLATRYALVNLSPFIFTGEAGLYSRFNTNGQLDLVNPTTGQGLSEQYLEDRAKFLALKNELAVTDRPWQETIPSDMHGYYEDRGSQFSINNTYNSTRVPAAEYIFGTDNADVIESFRDPRVPDISFNDHIFGGGSNDIIRTHAGDDYLEGGSGQDSMDGGAGDDTFFVQGTDTDYDVFRGGPDTDKILGSKGNDTIRVHRFTGEDTVEVIDGRDGIDVIAGTTLAIFVIFASFRLNYIGSVFASSKEERNFTLQC